MKNQIKIFLLCLLTWFPGLLLAQQNLPGLLRNDQGQLLDGATLSLSLGGKIVTQQLVTNGQFMLRDINESSYELKVSLIGHQPLKVIFNKPYGDVTIDTLRLVMKSISKQLGEVIIAYKKPLIERKIDRVVFNVENSIIANGGNVLEALGKTPGVQTTSGGITANNKTVTVYIDSKPVRLGGDDLNTYLQSLPAGNIAKIEVMVNPPSSYDAQGGAVINIVSKKIKAQGFTAILSSNYSQGLKGSYRENMNFNYRQNKLNVYGNYGYSDNRLQRTITAYTLYETANTFADWERSKLSHPINQSNNYGLGADYNLSNTQLIGILINGNNSKNLATANTVTNIYNNHKSTIDSTLNTLNQSKGNSELYAVNLNYRLKLNSGRSSLNFDVDYVPYRNNNGQDLNSSSSIVNGQTNSVYRFSTASSQKIDIWSGKLDYESKLGHIWNLTSGVKFTNVKTENKLDFFDHPTDVPLLNPAKSDYFKYKELTGAGYMSLAGTMGKWAIQGGLRAEFTRTNAYSVSLDSLNIKNYVRLYPTLFITYKFTDDQEFGLNYSKRIDRPAYSALNPAKQYSTPYNYQNGNPFLRPALISYAELNYTYHQNYTLSLFYNQEKDLAGNVTVQDNVNKVFYDTQQNIGQINDLGIQLLAPNRPTTWWEISNSAYLTHRNQSSDYISQAYHFSNWFYNLSTDHSFLISKVAGLKAAISGSYTSATEQGTIHFSRYFDVSSGLSKSLWSNHGTLSFNANDIFYSRPYRLNVNYLDQHNGAYLKEDTRRFSLGFTYKIGKLMTETRKRSTSSEEEKSRVN